MPDKDQQPTLWTDTVPDDAHVCSAPHVELLAKWEQYHGQMLEASGGKEPTVSLRWVLDQHRDACVEAAERERWVDTEEAARIAKVMEGTITKWCRQNRVRWKKNAAGHYLIDVESLFVAEDGGADQEAA